MPLDELEAQELVDRLWGPWREAKTKSEQWDEWAFGDQPLPEIPDTASREFQALQTRATTPWLGLVVQSLAQALFVEGYRTATEEDAALWAVWQANKMDQKQVTLYESAFTTGVSYVAVLPQKMPARKRLFGKEPGIPEWRPYSSAQMTAFYEFPDDDWPVFALAAEPVKAWESKEAQTGDFWVTLFDSEAIYRFRKRDKADLRDTSASFFQDGPPLSHGLSVVPVVRYVNRQKISGRAIGEVEPYVRSAQRIDQTVYERMVTQRFGAFRVRTAAGLEKPDTDEEKRSEELRLSQADLLVSEDPETKFGSLPESRLEGHIQAAMQDVRMLAAVSQTPPQFLTGDLINVSSEALAAFEAGYNRKVEQRKHRFGEAHEQAFGLSAQIMNLEFDEAAQVQWRDLESRSLAQTADALGKLASQLEIPVEVLWDRLGFLTSQDIDRAHALREQEAVLGQLIAAEFDDDDPSEPAA